MSDCCIIWIKSNLQVPLVSYLMYLFSSLNTGVYAVFFPSRRNWHSNFAWCPVCLQLIQNTQQHSVSYTLNRSQAVIVQYDPDAESDMFQIGRSSESPIDFVVMDTVPGNQRTDNAVVTQSTISRFACRILVDRNPPYTARIYAAGFDSGKNIFLGVCDYKIPFCILCLFFIRYFWQFIIDDKI